MIGRYFSACNAIDNHNMIWRSDLALEKYWVTKSGYFRLATTAALVVGISDGELLLYQIISDQSKENNI